MLALGRLFPRAALGKAPFVSSAMGSLPPGGTLAVSEGMQAASVRSLRHLDGWLEARGQEAGQTGLAPQDWQWGPSRLASSASGQGSTFNDPDLTAREAGTGTKKEEEKDKAPGQGAEGQGQGSGGFALLGAAHAGLAAAALLAPTALANAFFPGAALPQGMQAQALAQVLGLGAAAGAASCFALKSLADSKELGSPSGRRLALGLLGLGSGSAGLHLMYSPSITMSSLVAGAVVMGATAAVPWAALRASGRPTITQAARAYVGALPDLFRPRSAKSALYAVTTASLALAGASYLTLPGYTLASIFGYVKGVESFFLWQNAGVVLAAVAAPAAYTLKRAADEGALGSRCARILNAGLLAMATGHVYLLAPMWAASQGGPALPYVLGAWVTAGLASGWGLSAGSAATP